MLLQTRRHLPLQLNEPTNLSKGYGLALTI